MIKTENLTKQFGPITALSNLTTEITSGRIYGLVGSNGAGKSTLLRLLAGIYSPTQGSITFDGQPIYENNSAKQAIYFVADDLYFPQGATMASMAGYLCGIYTNWNWQRYQELTRLFPIPEKRKLQTCSKGMKRQAALVLALSAMPRLLLLDEAFDGLDPIIRVALRKMLADCVARHNMTVIIASHNLRELEDVCDQVGLLHQGKIMFQRELEDLKLGFCKVQAVFRPIPSREELDARVNIMKIETSGSLLHLVVRGGADQVLPALEGLHPLMCEAVPLTLEEVFIYEMEAVGYDYNNVLF